MKVPGLLWRSRQLCLFASSCHPKAQFSVLEGLPNLYRHWLHAALESRVLIEALIASASLLTRRSLETP
jgi:hypothetical protein